MRSFAEIRAEYLAKDQEHTEAVKVCLRLSAERSRLRSEMQDAMIREGIGTPDYNKRNVLKGEMIRHV